MTSKTRTIDCARQVRSQNVAGRVYFVFSNHSPPRIKVHPHPFAGWIDHQRQLVRLIVLILKRVAPFRERAAGGGGGEGFGGGFGGYPSWWYSMWDFLRWLYSIPVGGGGDGKDHLA